MPAPLPPQSSVARLVSVNVGRPRTVQWHGREMTSAIFKDPVDGPVAVAGDHLAGDEQANPAVHGGPDKAVYAYAVEDRQWWEQQLDRAFTPGWFGENLSTEGLDVSGAVIGEHWHVGDAVFEVCQPRFGCAKLGMRMGDGGFSKRFDAAFRPGAYLRVLTAGTIEAGDPVSVTERPAHGLTIGDVARAETGHDRAGLERMLTVPGLPANRLASAQSILDRLERT